IPPQDEPGLLEREPPRPTRAVLHLGPAPAAHVPADGALGQQPVTAVELPSRSDPHRLPPAAAPRRLRRRTEPPPVPGADLLVRLDVGRLGGERPSHSDANGPQQRPSPPRPSRRPPGPTRPADATQRAAA